MKTKHGSSTQQNGDKSHQMHKNMGKKFVISSDLGFICSILCFLTLICVDN